MLIFGIHGVYCALFRRRFCCEADLRDDWARRAADLGLVGVMARPNHLYGRNLGDPAYDPVWEAVAGRGIVLAVHEGLGVTGGPTIGSGRFTGFTARHALSHPMEQMAAMASLVLDGALERHPELRVAFLECDKDLVFQFRLVEKAAVFPRHWGGYRRPEAAVLAHHRMR